MKEQKKQTDKNFAEAKVKPGEESNKTEAQQLLDPAMLKTLEEKIKTLEEQQKTDKDKFLRLFAEFDNYRKRTQVEKEDLAKYGATELIKQLLPLMDSFERAKVSFEKHSEEKEDLKKGLALIHKQFEDILEKIGVKKIEAKGKQFDPRFHEAIMQQEQKGAASNIILEEAQPGFTLQDRVIRPAMVIVAK